MKTLSRLLLPALILFCSLPVLHAQPPHKRKTARRKKPASCSQGTPYRNCPACGTVTDNKHRTLNLQKNRDAAVTSPKQVTVQAMRDPANNQGKFLPNDQVWVTGYVASVDPGGLQETCNCKRTDLRDVHINVVADPSEVGDQSKYVVVEFTPRWEKKFNFDDRDYEAMRQAVIKQLNGKWVKFSGWMMFDFVHTNASQSTSPNNPICPNDGQQHSGCNWRATPWEVHPVTAYAVVSGP